MLAIRAVWLLSLAGTAEPTVCLRSYHTKHTHIHTWLLTEIRCHTPLQLFTHMCCVTCYQSHGSDVLPATGNGYDAVNKVILESHNMLDGSDVLQLGR